MQLLVAERGKGDGGWKRASIIVEQGILRETRALESIRVFGDGNVTERSIADMKSLLIADSAAKGELGKFYGHLYGTNSPAPAPLTDAERAASRKVPANVASLDTYLTNRQKVSGAAGGALHGLMRAEVYNFVDGRRSYYDIYKAVYAESAAAGSWYYGTVTLEDVVRLLDAAAAAGALTLK
jgi:hypothetical protein